MPIPTISEINDGNSIHRKARGETFTILGTEFINPVSAKLVSSNDAAEYNLPIQINSTTSLTATVPNIPLLKGPFFVKVTNTDGSANSSSLSGPGNVIAILSTVTDVFPATGKNDTYSIVTITGNNFDNNSIVGFLPVGSTIDSWTNQNSVVNIIAKNDTTLVCTVPPGLTPKTYKILVSPVFSESITNSGASFEVLTGRPKVDIIPNTSGVEKLSENNTGTTVKIAGSNFIQNVNNEINTKAFLIDLNRIDQATGKPYRINLENVVVDSSGEELTALVPAASSETPGTFTAAVVTQHGLDQSNFNPLVYRGVDFDIRSFSDGSFAVFVAVENNSSVAFSETSFRPSPLTEAFDNNGDFTSENDKGVWCKRYLPDLNNSGRLLESSWQKLFDPASDVSLSKEAFISRTRKTNDTNTFLTFIQNTGALSEGVFQELAINSNGGVSPKDIAVSSANPSVLPAGSTRVVDNVKIVDSADGMNVFGAWREVIKDANSVVTSSSVYMKVIKGTNAGNLYDITTLPPVGSTSETGFKEDKWRLVSAGINPVTGEVAIAYCGATISDI